MSALNDNDGAEDLEPTYVVKERTEVEIIMNDGSTLQGSVFLEKRERVSDLMNNADREFIPIKLHNGETLLVSRKNIAVCRPIDSEE